ncbi:MAG: hypothetical protein WC456_00265 [Patescibacteria group bacterium]
MRYISFSDIKSAVDLYHGLPAATFFKGLTGYGLVSEDGVESIGKIGPWSGIWKPMYFFISGGQQQASKILTADDIKKSVEKFLGNELFALLRVKTGKGIRLNSGFPEVVDSAKSETEISYELNHFGGRSITPRLEVGLNSLQDPNIKWQSGFLYQDKNHVAPKINKRLLLSRVLVQSDFADQASYEIAWQEVEKEIKRLLFMHCEGNLVKVATNGGDRVRTFFSQELTGLLPHSQIDKKKGFDYSQRSDGTVVIQKSVQPREYQDAGTFEKYMEDFTKECSRVYTLYCQPLSDAQRKKLGKPGNEEGELVFTANGDFERDERRSNEDNEQLIMWRHRRGAPHFPYEGWQPEKGKDYYVICHKWGNGYRVSPGSARYEQRTGEKFIEKIKKEFDGSENVIAQTPIVSS